MGTGAVPSAPGAAGAELDELVATFERGELPEGGFGHAAHVAVAFAFLEDAATDGSGLQGATDRMRAALRRFLRAQLGDDVAVDVKYKETITVAWMRLVAAARAPQDPARPRLERLQEVRQRLADTRVLLRYYSQQRLDDPAGRTAFLEPDLAPLPPA